MKDKIQKLIKKHKAEVIKYNNRVNNYLNECGEDTSIYFTDLKSILNYHRSALNTLVELETEL